MYVMYCVETYPGGYRVLAQSSSDSVDIFGRADRAETAVCVSSQEVASLLTTRLFADIDKFVAASVVPASLVKDAAL